MDNPYSGINPMFTPPPPSLGYSSDVQHWRETGFPIGGGGDGGFWNRVPPPMAESGLSRYSFSFKDNFGNVLTNPNVFTL